jgi:hypothetical protein
MSDIDYEHETRESRMERQSAFDEGIALLESRDRAIAAGEIPDPFPRPDLDGWDYSQTQSDERARDNEARIESATPEELAARLWGPPVSSEKRRAIDLELQQAKSRGLAR